MLSSVKTLHRLAECPTHAFEHIELKLTLKGIARLKQHCLKQAEPITPAILLRIHGLLDHSDPLDATLWCLFLFAFFSFARKSQLTPDTQKSFDPSKDLYPILGHF